MRHSRCGCAAPHACAARASGARRRFVLPARVGARVGDAHSTRRAPTQARDLGYASAAANAQLERTALLQRTGPVVDGAQRAQAALAWQAPVGGAGRCTFFNFASLPHAVALHVLSFVPAYARARAALVCRAWRALTGERSLWTTLDLSPASGVTQPVSDAVLRGAAARSGGQLAVLNADNCDRLTEAALLDVLTANAGSLLVLSWCASFLRFAAVEALVRAAPQLRILEVEAGGSVAEAVRMLRNEPPFGALQLRTVIASHARGGDGALEEVHAIAGAVTRQAALKCLVVHDFQLNTAAPLDTVMTAV